VDYFRIDAIDEKAGLKTKASKRCVPIHPQLIQLGVLEYVEQRRKDGGVQLFPLLKPNRRGQYGAQWGDWWRKYIRNTVGIVDPNIHAAHSFRHLFITELRRHVRDGDLRRALVGHTGDEKKDVHYDYGGFPLPTLAQAIRSVEFPGLNLSHLVRKS
jgi:integrase